MQHLNLVEEILDKYDAGYHKILTKAIFTDILVIGIISSFN
jgi:hypothetical protein